MRFFLLIGLLIFFSGCCSAGLTQFNDGKYYYADWCAYDECYTTKDGAACYKNKELVAHLKPLSNEEVRTIMEYEAQLAQQRLVQQQLLNQQLNQQLQQNAINNQIMLNQINQNTQQLNQYNSSLREYNNQLFNSNNNYIQQKDTIHTRCTKMGNTVRCYSY